MTPPENPTPEPPPIFSPPELERAQYLTKLSSRDRGPFMRLYAYYLSQIWYTSSKKNPLYKQAYELAETYYEAHIKRGRRYLDFSTFRQAFYEHCKNPTAKKF